MWPGLGEWDQIGCTFQYENLCSYIYSSIYLERVPNQQHSWTQEQQKILSICSIQRNCASPLNTYIDHNQCTMWMELGIKMGILNTIQIWKCKPVTEECGLGSSSLTLLIKRPS